MEGVALTREFAEGVDLTNGWWWRCTCTYTSEDWKPVTYEEAPSLKLDRMPWEGEGMWRLFICTWL